MAKIKKVLFIQKQPTPYAGVLCLSAALEAHGVNVEVLITSLERDLGRRLRQSLPDLIGLTFMSMERSWAQTTVAQVKKTLPHIPVVAGGIHAILYPQDTMDIAGVDYVCASEGEHALVDLVGALNGRRDPADLPKGMWGKGSDGQIVRRDFDELVHDLSRYPEDREVYYKSYPVLRRDPIKWFFGSRGCPFSCAFCYNKQLQVIFRNKGRYIRFKKPDFFVDEIRREKEKGNLKSVFFSDDLFVTNRTWMEEVLALYRDRVGLPFSCHIRPEFASDEVLRNLRESGCEKVLFGVETGNENLRAKVLGKRLTNSQLKTMASAAKKLGIQLHSFNMFGLPGETLENSFETIDLNIALGSDVIATSMYMPFPGTELAERAITAGALLAGYSARDIPLSFHRPSVLRTPLIAKQEKLHKAAAVVCQFPFLRPWVEKMIRVEHPLALFLIDPVLFVLFLGSFLFRYKGTRLGLAEMVKFLFRFRSSY